MEQNTSLRTGDEPDDVPDDQLGVQHQHVHATAQHSDHDFFLLHVQLAELQVLLVVVARRHQRDDEHGDPDRDPLAPRRLFALLRDRRAQHGRHQRRGHQQHQDRVLQGLEKEPQERLRGDLFELVRAERGAAGVDRGRRGHRGGDEGRARVGGGAEARGEARGPAEGGEEGAVLVLFAVF